MKKFKGIIKSIDSNKKMKAEITVVSKNNLKSWYGTGISKDDWEIAKIIETNIGKLSLNIKNGKYEIKGSGEFKGFDS